MSRESGFDRLLGSSLPFCLLTIYSYVHTLTSSVGYQPAT
jgi:hypothetical protein